ncbi:MAG: hypothetical protein AABM40_04540 [Chloroflexota bacterium]
MDIAELAKELDGASHDAVIVQDFLVIPRAADQRVALYSGGSGRTRNLNAFCRIFRGSTNDGYGCYFDGVQSSDHHPKRSALPREGKFHAAMNATMREARRRARSGEFD